MNIDNEKKLNQCLKEVQKLQELKSKTEKDLALAKDTLSLKEQQLTDVRQ